MVPNLASHSRVAFSSMAWNTGSSSPAKPPMNRSTSEVAACCSNASASRFCASASWRVRWSSCCSWSSAVGPRRRSAVRGLRRFDLGRLTAARLHSYGVRRCAGAASGHAINAIDVTKGRRSHKPSNDVQDHPRASERYHTCAGVERGFGRGRERDAPICAAYVRIEGRSESGPGLRSRALPPIFSLSSDSDRIAATQRILFQCQQRALAAPLTRLPGRRAIAATARSRGRSHLPSAS